MEVLTSGQMCLFYSVPALIVLFATNYRWLSIILLILALIAFISELFRHFSIWKENKFQYAVKILPLNLFEFTYILFCFFISVSKVMYHDTGIPFLSYHSFCRIVLSVEIFYGTFCLTTTENGEKNMLILVYDLLVSCGLGILVDKVFSKEFVKIWIFKNATTIGRRILLVFIIAFLLFSRECMTNLYYRKKKKGRLLLIKKMFLIPVYYIEEQSGHFIKNYNINHPETCFKTMTCETKHNIIAKKMLKEINGEPKGRIYLTETHQALVDYMKRKNQGRKYVVIPGITGKSKSAFRSIYGYNWWNDCEKCAQDTENCPYSERKRKTRILVFRKNWN